MPTSVFCQRRSESALKIDRIRGLAYSSLPRLREHFGFNQSHVTIGGRTSRVAGSVVWREWKIVDRWDCLDRTGRIQGRTLGKVRRAVRLHRLGIIRDNQINLVTEETVRTCLNRSGDQLGKRQALFPRKHFYWA